MKRKKCPIMFGSGWILVVFFATLSAPTTDETTTAALAQEEKSVWQKIEDFYADNNNMAMFCVLPIIILVYGGCSAIYCIYKCRRYLRRRKHKRLHEDDSSVAGDERNDLNQDLDSMVGDEKQPIKTVSGNNWDDDAGYNVQRKKTPLPWDIPQPIPVSGQETFQSLHNGRAHGKTYSAGSRDSSSSEALERERDKLEQNLDSRSPTRPQEQAMDPFRTGRKMDDLKHNSLPKPPVPVTKAADFNRFAGSRPIEIVPITQKEYQRHMENNNAAWDPLHNRPFDSRASGGEPGRKTGRDSAWSVRDEIMAKYDALTSYAMAKKTAEMLRANSGDPNVDSGHHPDTLRRKPGKKNKLIFIAE